jgi:SPP1 gp7 family putative phage head morphogenesis protein
MKDLFKLLTEEIVFEEAAEYFKDKLTLKPSEFYKLSEQYRSISFTVSGYTKLQVLERFHKELLKAIEEGSTLKDFKEKMNDFLENKGYKGITNFQADNIFRTNIQTAYQVGHYKQMTTPEVLKYRPYWQYDAVGDKHTRPSHLAMDGRVYKADNPIWDTWYPPNGFRCRCGVKTLSERQVKERNLKVETNAPLAAEVGGRFVNILPDPSFSHNPAKMAFKPNIESYPESLKKAYEKREKTNPK